MGVFVYALTVNVSAPNGENPNYYLVIQIMEYNRTYSRVAKGVAISNILVPLRSRVGDLVLELVKDAWSFLSML